MKFIKILCGCLIISLLVACQDTPSLPIQLRYEQYSVELGNPISKQAKLYLDMENYSEDEYSDIVKNSVMNIDIDDENIIHKNNEEYEKVGTYQASISYQDQVLKFKIEVKDNRSPQIQGPDVMSLQLNQSYNFKDAFKAIDYSDIQDLKVDSSKVDINKKGIYFLDITATDKEGNKNQKTTKVLVGVKDNQPNQMKMDIPYYNQMELNAPNGCEATSLYMALKYKNKININVEKFIEDEPRADTPYEGFAGNPFAVGERSDDYFCIFPSSLTKYGSQYSLCRDISNASLENIKYELSLDHPVLVYATGGFAVPTMEQFYFGRVTRNVHIVLLSGYDNTKEVFYVNDPASRDITEISYEKFKKAYDSMNFAIAIE